MAALPKPSSQGTNGLGPSRPPWTEADPGVCEVWRKISQGASPSPLPLNVCVVHNCTALGSSQKALTSHNVGKGVVIY